MHLVIISCSPRTVKRSNTDKIVEKFREGFEKGGNTAELFYLSRRNEWETARRAFDENRNILFAIPLYVECVPGIMLEFLETLEPKREEDGAGKTKAAFLLQGGFAEASQLRCGEEYLEKLPGYLGCEYAGTLIRGNMFAIQMMEGKARESLVAPFAEMGEYFAEHGYFDKERVSEFAKPEYFTKRFIAFYTLISPLQKLFFYSFSRKLGCRGSLKAKPYKEYVRR